METRMSIIQTYFDNDSFKNAFDKHAVISILNSFRIPGENGEFDTIYHEHISYYNARSMRALAKRAGLHLVDVVKTPIHGTSYIFVLSKREYNVRKIENILAVEAAQGLQRADTYTEWANNVRDLLVQLKEQVDVFHQQDYMVVGYGAAAKGMTLLNASGIELDAVVDDNPLKQGTWCPGTGIPVVSSEYIKQIPVDKHVVFIPLAWNFYDEIVCKIRAVRDHRFSEKEFGDGYMRYFPKLKVETF
jgi:hypothetical protein